MGKIIDLTGQRFGKLIAIKRVEDPKNTGRKDAYWLCKCDCGNEKTIKGYALRKGLTRSCGCLIGKCGKKRRNFIDLSGERFGHLLVIDRTENIKYKYNVVCWNCVCDCGNHRIVRSGSLRNGSITSCGCIQWGLKEGEGALNVLYGRYKRQAGYRDIIFDLKKEEFIFLTSQKCFYCDQEPQQIYTNSSRGSYIYNGIDRIDSNKGYVLNNVVACCGRCNEGKMDLSRQEFLSWIERVYNHSILKRKKNEHI